MICCELMMKGRIVEKGDQGFRNRLRGGMRDKVGEGDQVGAKGSEVSDRRMGRMGRKCELFGQKIREAESRDRRLDLEDSLWNAPAGRRG